MVTGVPQSEVDNIRQIIGSGAQTQATQQQQAAPRVQSPTSIGSGQITPQMMMLASLMLPKEASSRLAQAFEFQEQALEPQRRAEERRQNLIQDMQVKEAETRAGGEKIVSTFKQMYHLYQGDHPSATTGRTLAQGRVGGVVGRARRAIGKDPQAMAYQRTREGLATMLKEAVGLAGNLNRFEREQLINLMPDITDTPEEAAVSWDIMNEFFRSNYGTGLFGDEPAQDPTEVLRQQGLPL